MKILITGATGFIGRHLVSGLLEEGYSISGTARSEADAQFLNQRGVNTTQIDLLLTNDLQSLVRGHDCLIHCAAHVGLWGPKSLYENLNIQLTKRLLQAATQESVGKFIYMSCANVVLNDSVPIEDATEEMPICYQDSLRYAHSKAQAEQLVMSSASECFTTIALRPALVWGNGDIIDRQIGPAADRGQFGWFGHGRYPYSTCYIGNLCQAVLQVLTANVASGAFFIRDEEQLNLREFLSARLQASGYAVPTLSIPLSLAWPLARFTENGWNYLPLKGDPPLVREAVRTMGYPLTLSVAKAKNAFDYRAPYSVVEGLGAIQR
ncbi:NAD-dependent epimerase/dehydratase family protein [Polynucleobacter sp. HIN5]|uniref:NAD-dependent epimerase/dehydratase family protein n=1 Tax=Polynucleobacter sp. HIN5 TaxID=3047864 RepID=UPI002572ACB3|nr:NAD-dependent epimerase/dehydratase family protein [Polynucleobacter sp. HIN5]BEI34465.1 NAD-dependent epimerase/dehydratase family protein [Polynucleobacter sp. HIN5]